MANVKISSDWANHRHPGLEIEKKYDLPNKCHLACDLIFLPAKNGEVSYVVEMNVFMIGT